MKRTFILLLLFPLSIAVFAQKSKITVMTEDADITLSGILVGKTIKISEEQTAGFIVVSKKGHVTYGEKNEDILKKGPTSSITLTAIKKPATGFKSKKIEFTKFLDAANLSKGAMGYSYYGGVFVANTMDIDDPSFAKPIPKLMTEWGFSMIGTNTVFDVKDDAPDLVLAGEIIHFGKDTRGSGFQVSIIVNWSLLDIK